MLPVVTIVGRPNVGKSTLFNGLTRSRDALVADEPGVTRDRQYGTATLDDRRVILVDTGGLADDAEGLDAMTADQVRVAMEEADLILLVVDGKAGLSASDELINEEVRRLGKPVILVVNKTDGRDPVLASSEFARLGQGEPLAIAASQRRGLDKLGKRAAELLPEPEEEAPGQGPAAEKGIRLAVLGRPNVGKSTLVNRLLGEDRQLASPVPGTTRDSIRVPMHRDGQDYVLIDTAGIRRKARVSEAVEKFSVIKAMQAIDEAEVVLLLLDASEGFTDQDATLLGKIIDRGRALVIGLNKWDGLDEYERRHALDSLDRRAGFAGFAERLTLSALHGSGIVDVLEAVKRAYHSTSAELKTSELSSILEKAYEDHQPPVRQGRSAKLRYAHSAGQFPPHIVIHGSRTAHLPDSYKRYLQKRFTQALGLVGTPLRLSFRDGDNPFAGRKNKLSPRQIEKKKRQARYNRSRKK